MGEARQRGTFEERKAQAIAAGRTKRKLKPRRGRPENGFKGMDLELLATIIRNRINAGSDRRA